MELTVQNSKARVFGIIPGFDLMTHDLYFKTLVQVFTNHVLAESTYFTNYIEWTDLKIMILKSANKYQIICHCHNFKNTLINNFQQLQNIKQNPSWCKIIPKAFHQCRNGVLYYVSIISHKFLERCKNYPIQWKQNVAYNVI